MPENDPVGSVSIFKRRWATGEFEPACEVGFEYFNTAERTERLVARGMRVGVKDFTTFAMVRVCLPHDENTRAYAHIHMLTDIHPYIHSHT